LARGRIGDGLRPVNRGFAYRLTVPTEADGRAIEEYLAERYSHSTREIWQSRVERGEIALAGRPATIGQLLTRGQQLLWNRPPWEEPETPSALETLYDDGDLLAIAKPAGLPTLPGAGYLEQTVLTRVREFAPDAAPVHRLGRWTSGILLMARDRRTRAALSSGWGRIEKHYRALAGGTAPSSEFELRTPIGPRPHRRLGRVHAASPDGRPAHSAVWVLEQRQSDFICDVRITTGRPHQIRIHLACAGHPLVGDPLYRVGGTARDDALPGDPGYSLHAVSLDLPHPSRRQWLSLRCPIPEPLRLARPTHPTRIPE